MAIPAVQLVGGWRPCVGLVTGSAVRLRWVRGRSSDRSAMSWFGQAAGVGPFPPGPQQIPGIRFRHLDRAVIGNGAVKAGKQLDVADAARRAQADHIGPGICPRRIFSASCR